MLTFQKWSLLATLVALSLFVALDAAESQRSSRRNQPQNQATQTQKTPAADQRGTAQSPLIVRTIKTEEEAARDAKEREEKADLDRKLVECNGKLADYTWYLAWLAGFQFFALVVQAIVLGVTL